MRIPKWAGAIVGVLASTIFGGFLAWMSAMQLSASDMRVKIGEREQAERDVLRRLERIETKLDRVLDP